MKNIIFVFLFAFTQATAQTLPFDTMRFSSDGKYALAFEYNSTKVNAGLWVLYKYGLNQISDTVVIYNDSVYTLKSRGGDLNYFEIIDTTGKIQLNDFIKKFNLTVNACDITSILEYKIDTLYSAKRKVPNEVNNNKGDSLDVPLYYIETAYLVDGKRIYADTAEEAIQEIDTVESNIRSIKDYLSDTLHSKLFCSSDHKFIFLKSNYPITNYEGTHMLENEDWTKSDYLPGVTLKEQSSSDQIVRLLQQTAK